MLVAVDTTRLVAHDFDFEDWRPDRKTTIRKNVFLWVVPAQVAGVQSIALTSTPQKEFGGLPHPTILAACELLGVDETKRYLVLFTSPAEARGRSTGPVWGTSVVPISQRSSQGMRNTRSASAGTVCSTSAIAKMTRFSLARRNATTPSATAKGTAAKSDSPTMNSVKPKLRRGSSGS